MRKTIDIGSGFFSKKVSCGQKQQDGRNGYSRPANKRPEQRPIFEPQCSDNNFIRQDGKNSQSNSSSKYEPNWRILINQPIRKLVPVIKKTGQLHPDNSSATSTFSCRIPCLVHNSGRSARKAADLDSSHSFLLLYYFSLHRGNVRSGQCFCHLSGLSDNLGSLLKPGYLTTGHFSLRSEFISQERRSDCHEQARAASAPSIGSGRHPQTGCF